MWIGLLPYSNKMRCEGVVVTAIGDWLGFGEGLGGWQWEVLATNQSKTKNCSYVSFLCCDTVIEREREGGSQLFGSQRKGEHPKARVME